MIQGCPEENPGALRLHLFFSFLPVHVPDLSPQFGQKPVQAALVYGDFYLLLLKLTKLPG